MFTKKVKNKKKVRIQKPERESHEEGDDDDGGEIHNVFEKERRKKLTFFFTKALLLPPHFFPYLLLNLNVMQFGDKYHRTCILQMLQTISTILCVP